MSFIKASTITAYSFNNASLAIEIWKESNTKTIIIRTKYLGDKFGLRIDDEWFSALSPRNKKILMDDSDFLTKTLESISKNGGLKISDIGISSLTFRVSLFNSGADEFSIILHKPNLSVKIQSLLLEISALKNDLQLSEAKNKNILQDKHGLMTRIDELELENSAIDSKNEELRYANETITQYQMENDRIASQIDNHSLQIIQLETLIKELQADNIRKNATINNLRVHLDRKSMECHTKDTVIAEYKEELGKSMNDNTLLTAKYNDLVNDNQSVNNTSSDDEFVDITK